MVLLVEIRDLGQSYLVTAVLILEFVKIIFRTANDIHSIIAMSRVTNHIISTNAHKIRTLIVTTLVSSPLIWHKTRRLMVCITYISIMRGILRVLLSVHQRHPIDIIMMMLLVPPHDQLLLCSLEPNRPHWLCTIARDVDIGHVLLVVLATSIGNRCKLIRVVQVILASLTTWDWWLSLLVGEHRALVWLVVGRIILVLLLKVFLALVVTQTLVRIGSLYVWLSVVVWWRD